MFYKKNLWKNLTLIFFVVTILFFFFLINLVWLSNMEKLKFSTFLEHIEFLTFYLGFIFDRKLTFWQHINFYTNKALFTVKCMKMLGNSPQGLNLYQKYTLYRTCILFIILYSFLLWYYNKASLTYLLKELRKMQ